MPAEALTAQSAALLVASRQDKELEPLLLLQAVPSKLRLVRC